MNTRAFHLVETHKVQLIALLSGVFLFLALGWGPNYLLGFLSCSVLVVGIPMLWRPGEPPILLYIFLFQWLQASVLVFYANAEGKEVTEAVHYHGEQDAAVVLSLLGLVSVAIGMRKGSGPARPSLIDRIQASISRIPQYALLRLFVMGWLGAALFRMLAAAVPGLSQLLLGVAAMQWAPFVLLTYVTFARPGASKTIWLLAFGVELISSFGGFFGSFKEVFIYTLIGLVAAQPKIKLKTAVAGAAFAVALGFLATVWTAVKTDYRAFVSGGEANQTVVVDRLTALTRLFEMAQDLDQTAMAGALDKVFNRLLYTEFFGAVLAYVPQYVPHEGGALWFDAITRPMTPRILFPDKAIVDESLLTNTYTGLNVAGVGEGTQISLGYMADTYIDFGLILMFPALFAIGFVIGRIYRWLMYGRYTAGLLGLALAPPVLMPAGALEMSSVKLVGGLSATVLAGWLVSKYIAPRVLPAAALPRSDPRFSP